jgi:WD40 repeat protein
MYAISTSNGFQGNGCEITIWDLRNRSMLAELYGHHQTVTHARLIYEDRFIASCSNDSTVKIWDFKAASRFKRYLKLRILNFCNFL